MDNPYAPPPKGERGGPAAKGERGAPPPQGERGAATRKTRRRPYRPLRRTEPPPSVDPDALRAATRLVRFFLLLVLAALLTTSLPLPWQVGSLVFALVAVGVGLRALRVAWQPGLREQLAPLLLFGLVFAVLMTISTSARLALWPVEMQHQECLSRALTIGAHAQCEVQYQDALTARLEDLRNPQNG